MRPLLILLLIIDSKRDDYVVSFEFEHEASCLRVLLTRLALRHLDDLRILQIRDHVWALIGQTRINHQVVGTFHEHIVVLLGETWRFPGEEGLHEPLVGLGAHAAMEYGVLIEKDLFWGLLGHLKGPHVEVHILIISEAKPYVVFVLH